MNIVKSSAVPFAYVVMPPISRMEPPVARGCDVLMMCENMYFAIELVVILSMPLYKASSSYSFRLFLSGIPGISSWTIDSLGSIRSYIFGNDNAVSLRPMIANAVPTSK